jgi:hypothetical protein
MPDSAPLPSATLTPRIEELRVTTGPFPSSRPVSCIQRPPPRRDVGLNRGDAHQLVFDIYPLRMIDIDAPIARAMAYDPAALEIMLALGRSKRRSATSHACLCCGTPWEHDMRLAEVMLIGIKLFRKRASVVRRLSLPQLRRGRSSDLVAAAQRYNR